MRRGEEGPSGAGSSRPGGGGRADRQVAEAPGREAGGGRTGRWRKLQAGRRKGPFGTRGSCHDTEDRGNCFRWLRTGPGGQESGREPRVAGYPGSVVPRPVASGLTGILLAVLLTGPEARGASAVPGPAAPPSFCPRVRRPSLRLPSGRPRGPRHSGPQIALAYVRSRCSHLT
jgi:hypothetical protein